MKIDKKSSDSHKLQFNISFERESLKIVETPFGILLTMEECQNAGKLGGPSLPMYTLRIALPIGHIAEEVKINVLDTTVIVAKDAFVVPLQGAQPGSQERIKTSTLLHNKNKSFVDPYPFPSFVPPNPIEYESYFESRETAGWLSTNVIIGYTPVPIISILPIKMTPKGSIELRKVLEVIIIVRKDDVTKGVTSHLTTSQAIRSFDLTCTMVANTNDVIDLSYLLPLQRGPIEYLIITDNNRWDAKRREPSGNLGNIVPEFDRLVNWKRMRGLTAQVVTISDIINGVYGRFNHRYIRDLQEVIHNFLYWARNEWGVTWVLLGGDIDIIPPRVVAGVGNNTVSVMRNDPPNQDQAFWNGTFMKFNCTNIVRDADVNLINFDTGQVFPYDSSGTSSETILGWNFTTNDSYADRSGTRTDFIRINGPPSEANAPILVLRYDNSIPTDLYYANFSGSPTSVDNHAWDSLNNHIYGQHNDYTDFDNNTYLPDISVGRAPISSVDEARSFVGKVLAYEQLRSPDGLPVEVEYLRKILIVSDNWGGRIDITRTGNSTLPPAVFQYFYDATNRYTIIKLEDPLPVRGWRLIAQISEMDNRIVPYNRSASEFSRGWRFCWSDTDILPSEMPVIISGAVEYFEPLPSNWVVVFGNIDDLSPQKFIFDIMEPDGSLRDQELLRQQIQDSLPHYNNMYRLYRDEVDLTPTERVGAPIDHLTVTGLRNKMNEGQHFISLSGHGSADGCCGLNRDMSQNFTNGYQSFIVFADSCLTNEFNVEDAISEILLKNPNGGAVAYIGNSRYSWIGVGDNFQRAFFRRLTTTTHLGLLHDMRCNLVNEYTGGYRRYNKWSIYSLNLMGDPEMPIWRNSPELIYLDFNSNPNKHEPFEVTTTTKFGRTLSDILITLRQQNFFQQFPTNSIGTVEFDLNRSSWDRLKL